jgi:hypothetical protein
MPHVSEVRPASHDRHDLMLVAALAADDLAGADRDQAIALIDSCTACATVRDDLVALARATASAPPPIAARPRDFRLTPTDAARLRPSGWRRLVAALSTPRAAVTRPLGVGLATLGLIGLLVGNVQLGFGSAASAPQAPATGAEVPAASAVRSLTSDDAAAMPSPGGDTSGQGSALGPAPAASAMAVSAAPAPVSQNDGAVKASAGAGAIRDGSVPRAAAGGEAATTGAPAEDLSSTGDAGGGQPIRPLNVLFGLAIVVGIGLLVAPRLLGRRTV